MMAADTPAPGELLDALAAVREALGIPHAATVGDQETRDAILVERAGHATAMLDGLFERLGGGLDPMIGWSAGYLRERLADHPATGYRTWDERMAKIKAASKEAAK
jgi:hypothetical protein